MPSFTYQPQLRPTLALIQGPKEYREERDLFMRIDELLTKSGMEQQFVDLTLKQRQINAPDHTAQSLDYISLSAVLALRSNIARTITKLSHRRFCVRVADCSLLTALMQRPCTPSILSYSASWPIQGKKLTIAI